MSTPERINKLKAAMHGMAAASEGAAAPASSTEPAAVRTTRSPSRIGKRNVSAYVEPAAAKQLRMLAVELDTSTQALVHEALNDLFRKHGKSAIA